MVPSGMVNPPSPETVTEGVYLVGSSDLTDGRDCSVYLVDAGELASSTLGRVSGPTASFGI